VRRAPLKPEYDMIVIGGGAAGLTSAGISANLGAKTMMIEAHRLGGDCTWTGCIPSKVLLKAAKVASQLRHAGRYGLLDNEPEIDFQKIIDYVQKVREDVYEEADNPEIFEAMGIEVVHGKARFTDPHTVIIENGGESREVTSRFFIIATGSSAVVPPIDGLKVVPYMTNENLFEQHDFPESLVIIGAGPIGIEMAQAFTRLGSKVTVFDLMDNILVNDHPELALQLRQTLESEGVRFILGAGVKNVSESQAGISIKYEWQGGTHTLDASKLLVSAGRRANTEDLGLDDAGVVWSRKGIEIDNRCRTNRKHIFAAGDVAGRFQFTHMSEHMAKVAATNALLRIPFKMDTRHVPWATYTDPELAHVGTTEKELIETGTVYEVYKFPYSKIDRAVTDSETNGWIRVYAKPLTGKILGADILGTHAGDLIGEFALAMRNGISLRSMADTIHPYPTYGLGARRAADQWYVKNQKLWQIKLIRKFFGYRGNLPDLSDKDRIV
jgi:pyruvate/2-oxoglutarate dehydrogenase complex dihydrolipoamide dehydrogenase (E3) component